MSIIETSFVDVGLRSYDHRWTSGQHEFAQLVLPVSGEIHLEIEGLQRRLDPLSGGIVTSRAWHSQSSVVNNRSLILDIDQAVLTDGTWERLISRRFIEISPAARRLVEFMQISIDGKSAHPALIRCWASLLLDTIALGAPQAQSRLAALLVEIETSPSLLWTTESMARFARMSVSRLHALFTAELYTTPRAWLLRKRLDVACELLARTGRTIADVALSTGFADQSVLTRAMRQHLDITPAAYRRQRQETRQK